MIRGGQGVDSIERTAKGALVEIDGNKRRRGKEPINRESGEKVEGSSSMAGTDEPNARFQQKDLVTRKNPPTGSC